MALSNRKAWVTVWRGSLKKKKNFRAIVGTIEGIPLLDKIVLKGSPPEHLVMGIRDTKSFSSIDKRSEVIALTLYPVCGKGHSL